MTNKDEIKRAIKEAHYELREERYRRRTSREIASTTAGIFGTLGFLAGFLPQILEGALGMFLIGAGILFAVLTVFLEIQAGRSLQGAIVFTLAITAIPFLFIYGLMWYFFVYVINSGQPLFTFPVLK